VNVCQRIDLLFADAGVPNGISGPQRAGEARRQRSALKVLHTTGYARNAIVQHGCLDPDVELIMKPLIQSDLVQRVRTLIQA
jgi:hypothetical protein